MGLFPSHVTAVGMDPADDQEPGPYETVIIHRIIGVDPKLQFFRRILFCLDKSQIKPSEFSLFFCLHPGQFFTVKFLRTTFKNKLEMNLNMTKKRENIAPYSTCWSWLSITAVHYESKLTITVICPHSKLKLSHTSVSHFKHHSVPLLRWDC